MASWAVHFRIADNIIKKLDVDEKYFIIGNIAPDCGLPAENGYNPSSEITHRTHCGNFKGNCDYQSIYDEYIVNNKDYKARSFWIGYYVHLMTDCFWVNDLCQNICNDFNSLKHNDIKAKIIRKEWYNLDFEYFASNISYSFEKFKSYDSFNASYPEFYKNDEISKQIKNITSFYINNKPEDLNYKFTTPEDVERFIIVSSEKIYNSLFSKSLQLFKLNENS